MPFVSHVNTTAAIVIKLVERGHEVCWYTGRKYQAKVEATGADFVPFRSAPDFDDADPAWATAGKAKAKGLAGLKQDIKQGFVASVPGQVKDLQEILRHFPAEVTLADMTLAGVGLVHELGGPVWAAYGHIPLTFTSRDTAPFGMAILPSSSGLGRLRNWLLHSFFSKVLFRDVTEFADQIRQELGLSACHKLTNDQTLSPYLYLQGTVPGFEYFRSDLAPQIHFTGPFLSPTSKIFTPPEWWSDLNSGRPVVHITQGTVSNKPEELLIPAIKALADLDVLVVATTGGRPLESIKLQNRPANLRLEEFIPHAQLLPYVDVMVTNAGYGGVQIALANGVPLVAAGATEDKPEVANRIAWSGVGINLKTGTPRPHQILGAVKKILTDTTYRQAAETS